MCRLAVVVAVRVELLPAAAMSRPAPVLKPEAQPHRRTQGGRAPVAPAQQAAPRTMLAQQVASRITAGLAQSVARCQPVRLETRVSQVLSQPLVDQGPALEDIRPLRALRQLAAWRTVSIVRRASIAARLFATPLRILVRRPSTAAHPTARLVPQRPTAAAPRALPESAVPSASLMVKHA
jgi:hypothetical protein